MLNDESYSNSVFRRAGAALIRVTGTLNTSSKLRHQAFGQGWWEQAMDPQAKATRLQPQPRPLTCCHPHPCPGRSATEQIMSLRLGDLPVILCSGAEWVPGSRSLAADETQVCNSLLFPLTIRGLCIVTQLYPFLVLSISNSPLF